MQGIFVTGTDTGVGKTCVSTGLMRLWASQGLSVGGMKMVAAGTSIIQGQEVNEDVVALQAASTVSLGIQDVCPLMLKEPCAPHISAQLEGVVIHRDQLISHVRRTLPRAERWVIEGAGGFTVPLSQPGHEGRWGLDDIALDIGWPVVMVVGLRLGCLNHALLTQDAIKAKGLTLAGWVGNCVEPDMPWRQENLEALEHWMDAPCWGVVPYMSQTDSYTVSQHLKF